MIMGLCESPITFNAIIDWSTALNDGQMQLREILDLEAMLHKDPTPEQVEGDDGDEISEKTAGPSFKDEAEPEEAQAVDEDEEALTERRAPRPSDDEDEDNTLSLAQMEEQLKPEALEKFASIADLYRKFSKLQGSRIAALGAARTSRRATRPSTRSCARISPPRSKASSSTPARSSILSTSSIRSTGG